MIVLSIIRDCLDALLHPSARYDALTRARHRAFMAPRLLGSLVALAAFPIYLAMRGAPGARGRGLRLADRTHSVVLVPVAHRPLRRRAYPVRAGAGGPRHDGCHNHRRYQIIRRGLAHRRSLEAALSASRRVVAFASALALSCAALLIALGHFHLLPVPDRTRRCAAS